MGKEVEKIEQLTAQYKSNYQPDVDAGWDKLQARMQATKQVESTGLKVLSQRRWLSAAAAVLLIAIVGAVWGGLFTQSATLVAETGNGEQRTLTLPDGSTVVLNENSRIRYARTMDTAPERALALGGEAYFSVQSDPTRPFIITTKHTQVTVLGTAFNVRAYEQETFTEVEVSEGKVAFSVAGEAAAQLVLTAKEKGIFDASARTLYRKEAQQLNAQAWHTRRLQFAGTPLSEVFSILERHFKVKLEPDNPAIGRCAFTSNFEQASLEDIVGAIALSLGLDIKQIKPTHFVFYGNGCN